MKNIKMLSTAAMLVAISSFSNVSALTITDLGTTAPTGAYIIQTTGGRGNNVTSEDTNYFHSPGQTFTTTGTGVDLGSVDVRLAGYTGGATDFTSTPFTLTIGSVSGSTFTSLDSETADFPSATPISPASWISFTLSSPVLLSPSTQYAYEISSPSGSSLYFVINGTTGASNVYSGGQSINFTTGTSFVASPYSATTDDAFALIPSAVPEPSNWALVPVLGTIAFLAFRRFRGQASA